MELCVRVRVDWGVQGQSRAACSPTATCPYVYGSVDGAVYGVVRGRTTFQRARRRKACPRRYVSAIPPRRAAEFRIAETGPRQRSNCVGPQVDFCCSPAPSPRQSTKFTSANCAKPIQAKWQVRRQPAADESQPLSTIHYPLTTPGRRSPTRVACSKACAICNTPKSSRCRPTICTPTGTPSGVNPHGTEIAGCPVTVMK